MGVCYNYKKRKQTIRINDLKTIPNNNNNSFGKEKKNKNFEITHINEIHFSNVPTAVTESNPPSKITLSRDNGQTHSNLSSASSHIITPHSSLNFNIEATLGETEIPIYVDINENIIIQINPQSSWSFLNDENPVNYVGYQNYKYKTNNLGALFFRITGSQKIYHLDKNINTFKANSKGSLLFWANLDPNDYSIYDPKGFLSVRIIGGYYINETENYSLGNNNDNKNNNTIQEKKIIKYINKARNNILVFVNDYFNINENEINQELKNYINKNNFKRKELIYDKEINNITKEHCEYLCSYGTTGETDKDGLNIKDKIKKKCNIFFTSVNIIYGINNPLLIVKRMLLDKYSKSKINRNNLLFHRINKVGICLREHLAYKFCCVISFSE